MVEDFGFVRLVADVSEDVAPGNSVGTTNHPGTRDVSKCFPDVYMELEDGIMRWVGGLTRGVGEVT